MLKRVDDQYLGLFSPQLIGGTLMWPRSANDNPSLIVARRLECNCMIWSAVTENAGVSLVMQELVRRNLLLGDAGVCCLATQVSAAW